MFRLWNCLHIFVIIPRLDAWTTGHEAGACKDNDKEACDQDDLALLQSTRRDTIAKTQSETPVTNDTTPVAPELVQSGIHIQAEVASNRSNLEAVGSVSSSSTGNDTFLNALEQSSLQNSSLSSHDSQDDYNDEDGRDESIYKRKVHAQHLRARAHHHGEHPRRPRRSRERDADDDSDEYDDEHGYPSNHAKRAMENDMAIRKYAALMRHARRNDMYDDYDGDEVHEGRSRFHGKGKGMKKHMAMREFAAERDADMDDEYDGDEMHDGRSDHYGGGKGKGKSRGKGSRGMNKGKGFRKSGYFNHRRGMHGEPDEGDYDETNINDEEDRDEMYDRGSRSRGKGKGMEKHMAMREREHEQAERRADMDDDYDGDEMYDGRSGHYGKGKGKGKSEGEVKGKGFRKSGHRRGSYAEPDEVDYDEMDRRFDMNDEYDGDEMNDRRSGHYGKGKGKGKGKCKGKGRLHRRGIHAEPDEMDSDEMDYDERPYEDDGKGKGKGDRDEVDDDERPNEHKGKGKSKGGRPYGYGKGHRKSGKLNMKRDRMGAESDEVDYD